eukprot:scaffold3496_cov201-Pinguiococcus_pyrenoidosus.AAC.2
MPDLSCVDASSTTQQGAEQFVCVRCLYVQRKSLAQLLGRGKVKTPAKQHKTLLLAGLAGLAVLAFLALLAVLAVLAFLASLAFRARHLKLQRSVVNLFTTHGLVVEKRVLSVERIPALGGGLVTGIVPAQLC